MPTQTRLLKYERRPELLGNRKLTLLSLEIISVIERYRLIPSSHIVSIVGRDRSSVYRQLQFLWENGWINRFAFRGIRNPTEQHYYLDDRRALDLLAENNFRDPASLDYEQVRLNRQNPYTDIQHPDTFQKTHSRLFYANHELQISCFRLMLELA